MNVCCACNKHLLNVLWCTSNTTTCKATITCPINNCRQQINSGIWESSSPKISRGKKKPIKAAKRPTEYWGSLTAISGTKTKNIFPLYKSLVRQHLEHAVQFWSPYLIRDIDKIEKIQRRATKMIPEIRNRSYHQRLQDLDLISLVHRRLRGKLIEEFKCLNEFTTASARGLFDYDLNDRKRNNGAKLIVKHFNTSVAQHFYTIKITST